MNKMVLNAYTSQKEPKCINETHLFVRNLRLQRGEVGAGEVDATCVAGGISGRVLLFGVGASQIAWDFSPLPGAAESRIPPVTQAGRVTWRSDQLGHEVKNYCYLHFLREFTTEMLSFTLVW